MSWDLGHDFMAILAIFVHHHLGEILAIYYHQLSSIVIHSSTSIYCCFHVVPFLPGHGLRQFGAQQCIVALVRQGGQDLQVTSPAGFEGRWQRP